MLVGCLETLHKKTTALNKIWLQAIQNVRLIVLKERNHLSKLKSSSVEQDFKDVHRIGSRKEGITKLEEFMLQFVPILDQHKQDQKRIIESGVLRLESEVLNLLLEDNKIV